MHYSGTYIIANRLNGHVYIGSANNILKRFTKHKRHLLTNRHENQHLQNAYNRYGLDAFDFCLMTVNTPDIRAAEQEQLDTHCGQPYCYNIARTVDGLNVRTGPQSLDERLKKSATLRGRELTPAELEAAHLFPHKRISEAVRTLACWKERVAHEQRSVFATTQLADFKRLYREHYPTSARHPQPKRPQKPYTPQPDHATYRDVVMVHDDGRRETASTLNEFCKRHGYPHSPVRKVMAGLKPSMYGWRCESYWRDGEQVFPSVGERRKRKTARP